MTTQRFVLAAQNKNILDRGALNAADVCAKIVSSFEDTVNDIYILVEEANFDRVFSEGDFLDSCKESHGLEILHVFDDRSGLGKGWVLTHTDDQARTVYSKTKSVARYVDLIIFGGSGFLSDSSFLTLEEIRPLIERYLHSPSEPGTDDHWLPFSTCIPSPARHEFVNQFNQAIDK